MIWGTNVNITQTMEKFRDFFEHFQATGQTDAKYARMLMELKRASQSTFNLDCHDIEEYDPELYSQLVRYPQELIPLFDLVVHNIFQRDYPDDFELLTERLQVRPFNLKTVIGMRDVNPENIDMLLSVSGMVIRTSPIIPDIKLGMSA